MYIKSSEKKENLRISRLCIEFDFNSGKTNSLSIAFKIAPDLNFGSSKKLFDEPKLHHVKSSRTNQGVER